MLAQEVSLKELEFRARQISGSSKNGDSNTVVPTTDRRVHIPKDLVPSYVVGDDIDNWFEAYELALGMHQVPTEDWGLAYGSTCQTLRRMLY